MEPEFSVIIPSYNRKATLGRAIESVVNQAYTAQEIIVVDDGSTDNSAELVKNFSNVRYLYQDNKGVTAARNNGAEVASKDWLIFLDSDDEMEPNALHNISEILSISNIPQVLIGGFEKIELNSSSSHFPKAKDNFIPLSGNYLIRRDLFLEIGGFDERLSFSENSELFFRLRHCGIKPLLIDKVLLKYYPSNSGGSKNIEGKISSLQRICEKHAEFLSKKELFTYRQILGVLYLRLNRVTNAKAELWKAIQLKPYSLDTWGRYLLGSIPILSKQIYS